ncbi:MAG: FAD-dependent oxidoreductase [Acetobacteraceae bacterium]|nr:FAD-dependent oxidoreductase [Acetobacteraceae bacterium]
MKIGIVGAGIVGLCTAWALAKRGHDVTVFDLGPIPNPLSSSFDEHRIIRHAYGSMRGYALMVPQAFAAWDRLWADLGESHFVSAPATYCLRMEFDWYRHVAACLDLMGVAYRDVPMDEVAASLPMVNRDGLLRVVETHGAGMLRADRIVAALARHLPTLGVTLRPHTRIADVDPERARLDGWQGDAVVVAAGAWVAKLLGALPEALRTTAQTVVYLEPPAALADAWSRAPMLLNRLPTASGGVYILPPRAGTRLKLGDYDHNDDGDPDAPRVASAAQIERVIEAGRLALASFDSYRVLEAKSCFYTVTADENFAIRPLGARGWLASACSGHGFKFGALVGEAVADGVTGARLPGEVTDFMAARLTGRILAEV